MQSKTHRKTYENGHQFYKSSDIRLATFTDGKTKELYQIGISANSTGTSVYNIGNTDKKYLPETYGNTYYT